MKTAKRNFKVISKSGVEFKINMESTRGWDEETENVDADGYSVPVTKKVVKNWDGITISARGINK